ASALSLEGSLDFSTAGAGAEPTPGLAAAGDLVWPSAITPAVPIAAAMMILKQQAQSERREEAIEHLSARSAAPRPTSCRRRGVGSTHFWGRNAGPSAGPMSCRRLTSMLQIL